MCFLYSWTESFFKQLLRSYWIPKSAHVKIFEKLTKINDLTQNTCYLFDHKNALKIRFLTEFHVFYPIKGC